MNSDRWIKDDVEVLQDPLIGAEHQETVNVDISSDVVPENVVPRSHLLCPVRVLCIRVRAKQEPNSCEVEMEPGFATHIKD